MGESRDLAAILFLLLGERKIKTGHLLCAFPRQCVLTSVHSGRIARWGVLNLLGAGDLPVNGLFLADGRP